MVDFRRLSARHKIWESNKEKLTPICICKFPSSNLCWLWAHDKLDTQEKDECPCPCHIKVIKDADTYLAMQDLVQKSGRITRG